MKVENTFFLRSDCYYLENSLIGLHQHILNKKQKKNKTISIIFLLLLHKIKIKVYEATKVNFIVYV